VIDVADDHDPQAAGSPRSGSAILPIRHNSTHIRTSVLLRSKPFAPLT